MVREAPIEPVLNEAGVLDNPTCECGQVMGLAMVNPGLGRKVRVWWHCPLCNVGVSA